MVFAIYKKETGEIESIFNGPENQAKYQGEYISCSQFVSDISHFVNLSTLKIEAKSDLSPNVQIFSSYASIDNLPEGTVVECEGYSEIAYQSSTIEVDEPGTYTIYLDPPAAYKPKTLEIEIP